VWNASGSGISADVAVLASEWRAGSSTTFSVSPSLWQTVFFCLLEMRRSSIVRWHDMQHDETVDQFLNN
jgi:hypothetical protein